jgi:hypothetical protein
MRKIFTRPTLLRLQLWFYFCYLVRELWTATSRLQNVFESKIENGKGHINYTVELLSFESFILVYIRCSSGGFDQLCT